LQHKLPEQTVLDPLHLCRVQYFILPERLDFCLIFEFEQAENFVVELTKLKRFGSAPAMEQKVIELNVGGKLFKSTQSTLCSSDGYFARMLQHGNWSEAIEDKPIFIDRGISYATLPDHFSCHII
jgi:hypothetical protein